MTSPRKTPQKGIDYISQFPKYFVIPYGKVQAPTTKNFNDRLSENNTELFKRPKIHLSEAACTIADNLDVFDNNLLISEQNGPKFKAKLQEFAGLATKLDSRKSENTTPADVKRFVQLVTKEKISDLAEHLVQMGHKMFSIGIHLMVNKFLFENSEFVAERMNLNSRNDAAFKDLPTPDNFVKMLIQEIAPSTSAAIPSNSAKRSLAAALLDSSDEEELPLPKPKKKKLKNKVIL